MFCFSFFNFFGIDVKIKWNVVLLNKSWSSAEFIYKIVLSSFHRNKDCFSSCMRKCWWQLIVVIIQPVLIILVIQSIIIIITVIIQSIIVINVIIITDDKKSSKRLMVGQKLLVHAKIMKVLQEEGASLQKAHHHFEIYGSIS